MNKSIRNIIAGMLLAAAMSNILTIEAAIYAPSEHFSNLKNMLLQGSSLKEISSYNYDINKDSKKNVLDLCRMKKYALDNGENEILDSVSKSALSFSLGSASVNKSGRKITFPVSIANNSSSLSNFNLNFEYDQNSFLISDISGTNSNEISYNISGNTISCHPSAPVKSNGTAINIVLSMKDDIKNGTYTFSLASAEAYDDFGKLGNERINTSGNTKTVKLSNVQNMFPQDIPDPNNDSAKTEIFRAINSIRSESGLEDVSLNKELSYVADIRAQELSIKFDGATRPDGSANRTLLSQYGLSSSHNVMLYSSDSSAQSFISTLKNTYTTRIRDGSLGTVGIGHYYSGSKHYWVAYFSA